MRCFTSEVPLYRHRHAGSAGEFSGFETCLGETHSRFYAWQLKKEMAPATDRSGKLNPLLATISPKIREIDCCDCLASDLGWMGSGEVSRGEKMLFVGTDPPSYITEYTLLYEYITMFVYRAILNQYHAHTSCMHPKLAFPSSGGGVVFHPKRDFGEK